VFEVLVVVSCPVVVGGDINIHADDNSDSHARRLYELLASIGMIQHVCAPTHRCGHTLDLVITVADCKLDAVNVDPPDVLSDHSLVVCRMPVEVDAAPTTERPVRAWRQVDRNDLRRAIEASKLCQPVPDDANVDELFSTYEGVMCDIADRFAPAHTVRRHADRCAPWFDADCRKARTECRRYERRYRKSGCATDRRTWVNATRSRFQLYRRKKETYTGRIVWLKKDALLLACGRTSRQYSVKIGTSPVPPVIPSMALPPFSNVKSTISERTLHLLRLLSSRTQRRRFCRRFVRRLTPICAPYQHVVSDEVVLVRSMADLPGPVDLLTPYVTSMVNVSLRQGRLPDSQKHAIVSPLLKTLQTWLIFGLCRI